MLTRLTEQLLQEHSLAAEAGDAALPKAARVHHIAHRYGNTTETARDKLTWHAALLIEWDHSKYCTVVELAWLGGLGGYGGKSNWYDDRDSKRTRLYDAMPPELKMPWRSEMSEVRLLDIAATSVEDFRGYLQRYTGPTARFLDPQIAASSDVKLSHRSQADIFRYCLNYARHCGGYVEMSLNCQTFAADLFTLGLILAASSNGVFAADIHFLSKDVFRCS